MICSRCGNEARDSARFCEGCGAPLSVTPAELSRPVPAPIASGRYVASRLLGTGARKEVWLASDTRLGRDIALALVPTDGLDEAGRIRIDREARVMARLGDHPNVVTVLDVGNEEGTPFIVSQYMGGGTLADRLEALSEHQLEIGDAITVAVEIARGLDHAHTLDVIHRDIKPANVFFGSDGSAQLGDFGLAATTEEARLTAEGMVVGTVAYLPPEQTLGQELDPRSDLYSLGAVMYEMLTGRPPFVGENAVAVISQHLRADPVSPRWHNAVVSEELDALVLQLLEKAPEDRPSSASEVVERLLAFEPATEIPTERPQAVGTASPAEWGAYVGRLKERDQLTRALGDSLAGRPRIVMLVGEPGIGKTRTVEEVAAEAAMHGARVLWGHAYEGDIGAPYLPFVEALRGFTRDLPTDALVDVLASDVAEIASLVPDIHGRVPDVAELPKLDGEADRYRLYEAITSFLRRASRETPLMLVLEDLHWADKPSLMLLQYLARSLGTDRLFIVCTYRDVELERTHPLADTLVALRREQLYERILLQGMTVEEVKALMDAVGRQETPIEFAKLLHTETRGNPFFVAEMLQHLAESGSLRFEEGRWVGTADSIEMALPEGVRDVIGRRLDRLSPECNQMLTVAAAMTSGFGLDTIREVAGLDEDTALDALDEALAARIVQERRETRGSFDFTHALIRQTLYLELSTPRRARLHRQILDVIEARGADVAELAHHAFQCLNPSDVETTMSYAIAAAERAMETVAYEDAARHFDMALQALELAPDADPVRRAEILLKIADAHKFAGAAGDALRAADAAAEIGEQIDRPDLIGWAALHRAAHNPLAFAALDNVLIDYCESTERGLSTLDTHQALRARVLAAHSLHIGISGLEERLALAVAALEIAQATMDPEARRSALRAIEMAAGGASNHELFYEENSIPDSLSPDGSPLDHATVLARMAELQPEGDLEATWGELSSRIYRAYLNGEAAERRAAAAGLRQLATTSRSPVLETRTGFSEGVEALIDGRYDDATEQMRLFSKRCRSYGFNADLLSNVGVALLPAFREQKQLESLVEPTRAITEKVAHPAWRAGLALILVEVGENEEAGRLLDEMMNRPERIGGGAVITYARAMLAETAAVLGNVDVAESLLAMMEDDTYPSVIIGPYVYHGATDRYRGLLQLALGRAEAAAELHRKAIESAERMDSPPWVARGRLDLARALLAGGDPADQTEAVELLNDALVTATELGMLRLIDEVTEEKLLVQGLDPGAELSGSIAAVARSVQLDKVNLPSGSDGRLTLLFSDIVGYTAMNERLGDQAAHDVLQAHNEVLRRHLRAQNGTEVKSEGDGFMLTFETPTSACLFALGFDSELAALDLGEGVGALRVRMGVHSGEVIRDNDDLFGRTVIIAARIASHATAGEILLSETVATEAANRRLILGEARQLSLKGLSGEHQVHQLLHG